MRAVASPPGFRHGVSEPATRLAAPPFALFEGWGTRSRMQRLWLFSSLPFVSHPRTPALPHHTRNSESCSNATLPESSPDLSGRGCDVCSATSRRACGRSTQRSHRNAAARRVPPRRRNSKDLLPAKREGLRTVGAAIVLRRFASALALLLRGWRVRTHRAEDERALALPRTQRQQIHSPCVCPPALQEIGREYNGCPAMATADSNW